MIIVDVGAHVGAFIDMYASGNTPTDSIHLFEPNPMNYGYLMHKYEEDGRICFNHVAVSNYNGTATLFRANNDTQEFRVNAGRSTLYADNPNINWLKNHYEVEVIKLSDYWKHNIGTTVDILKIDTEGAELDILEDLLDAGIINQFQHIIFEHHFQLIPSLVERAAPIIKRLFQEHSGLINHGDTDSWSLFSNPIPRGWTH